MKHWLRAAVNAGLIAGTVDIGAASIINWVDPGLILRVIASGVLGRAARHEGPWVLAVGLLLQWAMSILIAAVFLIAAVKLPVLLRRWILAGIAYGVVVYVVMTYVVVPLSAAGLTSRFEPLSMAENLVAMIVFGLIVSYVAQLADRRPCASAG